MRKQQHRRSVIGTGSGLGDRGPTPRRLNQQGTGESVIAISQSAVELESWRRRIAIRPAAMVMSSTLMLQALPLPGRLLPKLSIYATTTTRRAATAVHHRCFPSSGASLDTFSVACVSRFANPRLTSEVASPGARRFSCAASPASSWSSAMAGACSEPPPMYRANVGVCLINDQNQVYLSLQASPWRTAYGCLTC